MKRKRVPHYADACIAAVAGVFDVTRAQIIGRERHRAVAAARQAVYVLMRRRTRLSYPQIAKLLGNRHHTTVLYGCQRIEQRLKRDHELATLLERATERLDASRLTTYLPRGI